jgi:hypothetical protein
VLSGRSSRKLLINVLPPPPPLQLQGRKVSPQANNLVAHSAGLLDLLYGSEDSGSESLRNVEKFLPDYTRHIPEVTAVSASNTPRFISYQAKQVGLAVPPYFNTRHLRL